MRSLLVFIIISTGLFSCNKSGDQVCNISVPGIAGSFRITKQELIDSTGLSTDVTKGLSACQLSGVFKLNPDTTASYTEAGPTCAGSFEGTWNISDNKLTLTKSFGPLVYMDAPVTDWDCRYLIISQNSTLAGFPVVNKTTFTRQ